MPGQLPDLLDVAGLRLVPVVDAERELLRSGARRPVTGSRNQSGSALSDRGVPRAPSRSRPAPVGGLRRARPRPREPPGCGQTPAVARRRVDSRQDARRQRRRLAGPHLPARPRRAASDVQRAIGHLGRLTCVGAVAGTSRGRDGSQASPACPVARLRSDGERGSGGRDERLQRDRHGGAGADGLDEAAPAARAGPCPDRRAPARALLALRRPHGGPLEVVQPRRCGHPPATSRVSFGKRRAAAGDVGDRRHRAVGEAQGGVHVRPRRRRACTSTGVVPDQRAQRVDEVTALADEPGPLELLVEVPAARVEPARVDEVARATGPSRPGRSASAAR